MGDDTIMGTLSNGRIESTRLKFGLLRQLHLFGSIALWIFGALYFNRLQHNKAHMLIHRLSGRAVFFLWFLLVGPSTAILCLFTESGEADVPISSVVYAVVSLDLALMASWCFWRAWRSK